MGWIAFAPLSDVLQNNYGVSIYLVNYLSQSFMLAYIPMNQPAVYVLDRIGLKTGMTVGIVGTTIGLWMKCLINISFNYVVIGQTVIAIAQPFMLNACSKLSANWYPAGERLISSAIASNAFILGVSLGLFLPSLFVDEKSADVKQ